MDLFISFWNVLAMMAPWLLIGFFLAGVASVLLPREWAVKAMLKASHGSNTRRRSSSFSA